MLFFSFFYNTVQKRANDRNNKDFWLPGVLEDIDNPDQSVGGKLLPLRGQDWSLGTIEGQTGVTIALSIIGAAGSLVAEGQTAAPVDPSNLNDPDNYPTVSVSEVEILGLDNLYAYPDPTTSDDVKGYKTTIQLKFNEYDDLDTLSLKGSYKLVQKISVTPPLEGQSAIQTVTGTGTFVSTLTDVKLVADVDIFVTGSGSSRQPEVIVTQLQLVAATDGGTPAVSTEVLTINADPGYEDIWLNISNNALNSPDASTTMLQSVTQALNEPSNLNSLNETMTSQVKSLLNSLFGEPAQLPTDENQNVDNPADLYIFDRIRAALNDPGSELYLPQLILSVSSPTLEPLVVDKLDLGPQKVGGLTWDPNELSNIDVQGLANNTVAADQVTLQQPLLIFLSTQGGLTSSTERTIGNKEVPAPPLMLSADFSLTPPGGIDPVTGTLAAKLNQSHLDVTATASGAELDELVITFQKMVFQADTSNLDIDLTVTSDSAMNSFAQSVVDEDSVKQELIDQINSQISNYLPDISQQVTQNFVSYANTALDD